MKNNILKFITKYKQRKEKLERRIKPNLELSLEEKLLEMDIEFVLCINKTNEIMRDYIRYEVIYLDDEDIDYFYKKYAPRLEEEKKNEINKIEQKYSIEI